MDELIKMLDGIVANPDNLENIGQIRETLQQKAEEIKNLNTQNEALSSKVTELRDLNQKLYLKTTGVQPVTPDVIDDNKQQEPPKPKGKELIMESLGSTKDMITAKDLIVNFNRRGRN